MNAGAGAAARPCQHRTARTGVTPASRPEADTGDVKNDRDPDRHTAYLAREHRVGGTAWFELLHPGRAALAFASWRALIHHLQRLGSPGSNAPPKGKGS